MLAMAAAPDALGGEDKSHEAVMATLDAQIEETLARVEQVCGEKNVMLDEVRALRAEGGKPTPEQIQKGIGAMRECSTAKTELTGLEADHAKAKADESGRRADESFQELIKSIRGEG